jgi:YHS domain-containing protein
MRSLIGPIVFALTLGACAKEPPPAPKQSEPAPQQVAMPQQMPMQMQAPVSLPQVPAGQKVVAIAERDKICMVNDQFMGKTQIPIDVEGKTYFGCCKMCKDRLEKEARFRTGTDPISGRPVDKAKAVIGMLATGDVLYFESEETFRKYNGA